MPSSISILSNTIWPSQLYADQTDHFIVDFMEVNLANFVDHILALKCDKSKTPAKVKRIFSFSIIP